MVGNTVTKKAARKPTLSKKSSEYVSLSIPAATTPTTWTRKIRLKSGKILLSPVNPEALNCSMRSAYSRRHYNIEKDYDATNTKNMQWDQPSNGKTEAKVGHLFGYAMTAGDYDKIEIHRVKGLGSVRRRREHWNEDIPEQDHKNVVYLSDYIGWVSSKKYVKLVREMGKKVPSVNDERNKNFGKLMMKNGTQLYDWPETIDVHAP